MQPVCEEVTRTEPIELIVNKLTDRQSSIEFTPKGVIVKVYIDPMAEDREECVKNAIDVAGKHKASYDALNNAPSK
jgi:hypothetical protein